MRRRRRRRLVWIGGAAGLGLLVLAGGWIVVTGLMARSHLDQVRADLPRLRTALSSGDSSQTRQLAADIASQAHRAQALTSGPAWWAAAHVPFLGSPLATGRTLADQADRIGRQVLPGVVSLASQVRGMSHLQGSAIDLDQITAIAPALDTANRAADAATQAVAQSSPSWLGPVASARSSVLSQLDRIDDELSGAQRAVQIALPMLGQSGPKRYLVGFMNEAESRGLGGVPGSFAIVTADHGKITFTHFGADGEMKQPADVDLGPEFAARYGQDDPTGVFPNSDLSPDFSDAARIWAGMWQATTGQTVDGAFAVDPTALSYLLAVTGPATMPDGSRVTADNVVSLAEEQQYRMYRSRDKHDTAERKQYLSTMAKAISQRLLAGGDGAGLVRAASRAAGERRLMVWSADPAIEKLIVQSGWAGALDANGAPFSGFVVNNAAGSKLDYYLDRTMSYERTGCGAGSTAVATLTLTNAAPRSGLPAYVTFRADTAASRARPGDNRLLVTYYGTPGATIQSVQIDGKPVILASLTENGLTTITADLELPVGATRTITVHVREPAADRPVQLFEQPLVRPMKVTASGDRCG